MITSAPIPLVHEVTCPNCWERFPPERVRYVSTHPDLYGDLRLGDQAHRRFLPTQFHPDGRAIDSLGGACHQLACPKCHLIVPRVMLERPTLFASVFGSPSSGKSFFLASMTHQLRRTLPGTFCLNFSDADPEANAILHHYENTLFAPDSNTALVSLEKTEVTGSDKYQLVDFDGKKVRYPKPFFFQISPIKGHPNAQVIAKVSRTLCMYDNAGESFQPGADRPDNPTTLHLAKSNCLIFIYDPTQEPAFRKALAKKSKDPQVSDAVTDRQDVLLAEVARRVKTHRQMPMAAHHDKPMIVVVSKFDAWKTLIDGDMSPPWEPHSSGDISLLSRGRVEEMSSRVRRMLTEYAPGIVSTAESFVDPNKVLYVPVSATGGPPKLMEGGGLGYRAGSLSPAWVEVPLLHVLHQHVGGLVPSGKSA